MTRRRTFDPNTVAAGFWRRDDVRTALARREIGHLFRIYLQAHPQCTQIQLALMTGHDRSEISNFVRGARASRVADIEVLTRIADGICMPDQARVIAGLAPADMPISVWSQQPAASPTTPSGHTESETRGAAPPLRQSTDTSATMTVDGTDTAGADGGLYLRVSIDGREVLVPISRRAVLGVGVATALTGTSQPTQRPRRTADVDPRLAAHWTQMLQVLVASHNMFGPRRLRDVVMGELAVIGRHRREASRDTRLRLLAVEARWAEFASWASTNLGNTAAEGYWLDRAASLAKESHDPAITGYVLTRKAQHAADQRHAADAVAYAESARHQPGLRERAHALCAVRQAHGHALDSNARSCRTAITDAYRLAAKADDTGVDDDPATIGRYCTHGYVATYDGACRILLGRPDEAINILEDALATWPADYRQDEGLCRGHLGVAYHAADRTDEATAEALHALTLATATSSARTMSLLATLDGRLALSPDRPGVARFRAAYATATGTTGRA